MSNLDKQELHAFIAHALKEDIGDGDHTSLATIPQGKQGKAELIIKEPGILAGLEVAVEVFHRVDHTLNVTLLAKDGDAVQVGDRVLEVSGSVHAILMAERLVLNVMQRMSGIATTTHQIVALLKGTKTQVLDTRKTTPGIRFLEKAAVKIGGGVNHRIGLFDMILIKDNHVDYAGGIKEALEAAQQYQKNLPKPIQIEIEVRNIAELNTALMVGGIDRILLDNFDVEELTRAVAIIDGRYTSEASGGITLENVKQYASSGVDFISMGALTHSVKSLDMSLKARMLS